MQKTTNIYYFSGTGNTFLAVSKLAEVLRYHDITTNIFRLEKSKIREIPANTTIGLAFPVAASSTYPLVWDFIEKLPQGSGTEIFMLDTLAGHSGGIIQPLGKYLKNKGYTLIGAKEIIMPSNFLRIKIDNESDQRIIRSGLSTAEVFAEELINGNSIWPTKSILSYALNIMRKLAYASGMINMLFAPKVDKNKCTGCNLCVNACPVNNIKMIDNKAFIGSNCQACMRCFGLCQYNAISKKGITAYKATNLIEMVDNE